jgi:hypothetical protein
MRETWRERLAAESEETLRVQDLLDSAATNTAGPLVSVEPRVLTRLTEEVRQEVRRERPRAAAAPRTDPRVDTLVARLVVQLTRDRVVNVAPRVKLGLADVAIVLVTVFMLLFASGWTLYAGLSPMAVMVVLTTGVLIVIAVIRVGPALADRRRRGAGLRLAWEVQARGVREVAAPVLAKGLRPLLRAYRLAERFAHPGLARQVAIEVAEHRRLLKALDSVPAAPVVAALRAELPASDAVPIPRYRRAVALAGLSWLTGLPLSPEAACRTAVLRLDREVREVLDAARAEAARMRAESVPGGTA